MKVCKICNIEKEFGEFSKNKNRKDGLGSYCKDCNRERSRKNRESNPEYSSRYRELNKEKFKSYSKKYRESNKSLVYERKVKSYEKKKEYYSIKRREYKKNRINSDPLYKIYIGISALIRNSFNRKGFSKKSKTSQILGCDYEYFKIYLESKFEPWMNWDNRGKYNGEFNYGWDLDHIVPISSAQSEEDIIKLNHYTNLQPLCSKINRDIKTNKIGVI